MFWVYDYEFFNCGLEGYEFGMVGFEIFEIDFYFCGLLQIMYVGGC